MNPNKKCGNMPNLMHTSLCSGKTEGTLHIGNLKSAIFLLHNSLFLKHIVDRLFRNICGIHATYMMSFEIFFAISNFVVVDI